MSYDSEHHLATWSGIGASLGIWAFAVFGMFALDNRKPQAGQEPSVDALVMGPPCGPPTAERTRPTPGEVRSAKTQVHAS